jgi:FkbM family methyltransferase
MPISIAGRISITICEYINRRGFHSTGPRSATGRQWREAVQTVISKRCRTANLLCEFKCDGESFRFRIVDPFDPIQRHLLQGTFFELAELRCVRDTLRKGAAIVDIGASIGSHAVYLSRFLEPDRILLLERGAELFDVLDFNLHLNGVANAHTSVLDLATGTGQVDRDPAFRETAGTGTGHTTASRSGAVRSNTLDSIVRDRIDLIRIGVPGAELAVLAGGRAAISRFRPHLLVTVSDAHLAVEQWCQAHGYGVLRRFEHENHVNLFLESLQST